MRRLVALLSAALAVLVIGPVHVRAQPLAPGPVGGLTALPPTNLEPNLLQNSGFETLSGGLPAAWSSGAGWSADQVVTPTLTATGATFTDTFGPFEAHVYVI